MSNSKLPRRPPLSSPLLANLGELQPLAQIGLKTLQPSQWRPKELKPENEHKRAQSRLRKARERQRDVDGQGVFTFTTREEYVIRVLVANGVLDGGLTDSRAHVKAALVRYFEMAHRLIEDSGKG